MIEIPPGTPSAAETGLAVVLRGYLDRFAEAAQGYDGSTRHAAALEELLASYAQLVTDPANEPGYGQLAATEAGTALVAALRTESARCVAVIEKYRALRLLEGRTAEMGTSPISNPASRRNLGPSPRMPAPRCCWSARVPSR